MPAQGIWDLWASLTDPERAVVVLVAPLVLFVADVMVKTGFGLDLRTAGGDRAMAAIGIDVAQVLDAVSGQKNDPRYGTLFLLMLLGHFVAWLACLWLVHAGVTRWPRLREIGSSLLGFLALYSGVLTVAQFLLDSAGGP